MNRSVIYDKYLEWLFDTVYEQRYSNQVSYDKLLMRLHSIDFTYTIPRDSSKAEDGIDLRYRFAVTQGYEDMVDIVMDILDGPCSVLEMMIALAIHCEEDIMDDPRYGNRTAQWFWNMIISLGLGPMMDHNFDRQYVDNTIGTFLNRRYKPDGRGGLFTIKNCDTDLRDVEIEYQLYWYLNHIEHLKGE